MEGMCWGRWEQHGGNLLNDVIEKELSKQFIEYLNTTQPLEGTG